MKWTLDSIRLKQGGTIRILEPTVMPHSGFEHGNPKQRSSCSQMFFKIGVPENFAIFTEKQLCLESFFN